MENQKQNKTCLPKTTPTLTHNNNKQNIQNNNNQANNHNQENHFDCADNTAQLNNEINLNNSNTQFENTKLNSSMMSVNVQLILKQIYEFYCQYGERLNTQYLKSHKFFKFAQEANLYDTNLTKVKLELIYKSEVGNEKLMDFKTYLNSLVKIAHAKYNSNQADSLPMARKNSSNLSRIGSAGAQKPNSSAAYANNNYNNRSSISNSSFSNSQFIENKQKKSSALGRLINELIVPLHSSIFNNGSLGAFASEGKMSLNNADSEQQNAINNNNNSSGLANTQATGLHRSASVIVVNTTRLEHKSISESKFIESLLVHIIPNLYDIYKIYFPHEVSISEDEKFIKDSSYKMYLLFLKDFDLCPGLITRTVCFQIFQNEVSSPDADAEISENQEYYINLMKKIDINELTKYDPKNANIFGQFLNFFKFIRILVKIAQVAYDSTNLGGYAFSGSSKPNSSSANLLVDNFSNNNLENNFNFSNKNSLVNNRNYSAKNVSNSINNINDNLNSKGNNTNFNSNFANLSLEDKLILTLERIELSEGFLNLEKKTMKTHSKRTATLIPQNMLNNLKLIYSDKLMNCDRSSILAGKDEERKQTYQNNIRLATNYREICEFNQYIMQNWGEQLFAIFKGYCAYGDYLNTKYMTSKKFFKFLNDCKLLEIGSLVGPNFNLSVNESCRSLNISRSVDHRLNSLITPKVSSGNNNINFNKAFNNNKNNNNKYSANNLNRNMLNSNLYEKEIENFGANLEAGDSQIMPGHQLIKLLKPNDIDSIFVKLCAGISDESANAHRHSLQTKQQNRDSNLISNTSTNDLFAKQNTSSYGLERSSSSNRFSIKKVKDQRIQFNLFIVAIEIIARLAFGKTDVKTAIDRLVLDYILKNVSGKYTEKFNDNKIKIEYLKKKQDDPELLKVLEMIYETFGFAYEHYADRKGLMSFSQLMK